MNKNPVELKGGFAPYKQANREFSLCRQKSCGVGIFYFVKIKKNYEKYKKSINLVVILGTLVYDELVD